MPTTRCHRLIDGPIDDLWEIVSDPHHLPRWWPRVERVEGVEEQAFTEVLRTSKGKLIRADFAVLEADAAALRLVWSQQVEGSPFASVLAGSETEIQLAPAPGGTDVAIELRQTLRGPGGGSGTGAGRGGGFRQPAWSALFPRLGSRLVGRGAAATLEEALDGLQAIGGGGRGDAS